MGATCKSAKFLLTTGKTPSKQQGKVYTEIRRLFSTAQVDSDNLLIVKSKPTSFSKTTQDLIVIPTTHLPAVLWQLHNKLQHPAKSQLKAQFERTFFAVGLQSEIDKIYYNCHFTLLDKKFKVGREQSWYVDFDYAWQDKTRHR